MISCHMLGINEFQRPVNIEDEKRKVKEMEIEGVVLIFDMTSSTALKVKHGFPGWVPYLDKFRRIVEEFFPVEDVIWKKFLGDAYMFFFQVDDLGENTNDRLRMSQIPWKKPDWIYSASKQVMDSYWEHYQIYSKDRRRGDPKPLEFREITCAIDFGREIINYSELESDHAVFDPIGTPVDRAFRISSLAGPGQLLISKSFFNKLSYENQRELIKISIKKGTMKGFPDDNEIYFREPPPDQMEYILNQNQVELVEEASVLSTKAKMKILGRRIRKLEQDNGKHEIV